MFTVNFGRKWWNILFFCFPVICSAQSLAFVNNNKLELSGNVYLVLSNPNQLKTLSIINNKVFNCIDASTVYIASQGRAYLNGVITFQNLSVDLNNNSSTNTLQLISSINVNGDLSFISDGLIDLNTYNIILANGNTYGNIIGETNTRRITSFDFSANNGGTIQKTVGLSNPTYSSNFGNMGLQLTTAQNLGGVKVIRAHKLQTNGGSGMSGVYRYFDIKPTLNPSGNSITATFNYFDAEVVTPTFTGKKDELTQWHSEDNGQSWLLNGDDAHDVTNDWVMKSNIATMFITGKPYRLTLGSTVTSPLPVQLINFSGNWNNGNADIKWKVSNDGSLHHIELEHSQDGVSFSKLSDILAIRSAITEQQYSYTDQHPYSPVAYYRLKVVDNTQKYFYSNVIKLKSGTEITASLYPNPATDHTYLSFSSLTDGTTLIQLFNSAGQLVRNKTISFHKGDNVVDISLANLPNGIYIFKSTGINVDHNMLIKN